MKNRLYLLLAFAAITGSSYASNIPKKGHDSTVSTAYNEPVLTLEINVDFGDLAPFTTEQINLLIDSVFDTLHEDATHYTVTISGNLSSNGDETSTSISIAGIGLEIKKEGKELACQLFSEFKTADANVNQTP